MKKTMKLLAAALAGTLVLGGCAGNKENTAASAESETVKETEAQSTEADCDPHWLFKRTYLYGTG